MTQDEAMTETTETLRIEMHGAAVLFYLVTGVLVGFGVFTMFAYDPTGSGRRKLVGADAYNLVIIANRGVGFVAAGIVSAIIALGVQVQQFARLSA